MLSEETVDAVTSLTPEQARPADLLLLSQRHWWMGSRGHGVRDAVFTDDSSTTYTGSAPRALSAPTLRPRASTSPTIRPASVA